MRVNTTLPSYLFCSTLSLLSSHIDVMLKNVDIFGFHTEWVIVGLIVLAVIFAFIKHYMQKQYLLDFEAYKLHLERKKQEKLKKKLGEE